jgi:amidohydrolase
VTGQRSPVVPGSDGLPALDEWLEAHHDELVTFRRHLHANPELSGEEHETTRSVNERLLVAGLEPRTLPLGTGLTCDLDPGAAGGTGRIALRADLDALAMDDGKDVPYRSTRPGVTHACGHDVHTTIVLGAALALHDLFGRGGEPLPVRLLFQPAEERLPGGAVEVIAAGGLDGVEEIYGVHCDPRLAAGQVGLLAGPITSATDALTIRLGGPGGHTARPERTVDLIRLAGTVATELPGRVEHLLGGRVARITFGSIHAGDAANVIPSHAELRGTARTPDVAVWDALEDALGTALAELADPHGATWDLRYTRGHPPVVNDPVATAHMVDACRALLGVDALRPTVQSVGGDDFSWYLDRVPGCYARLGVADPVTGAAPADLHAHEFDVDERCIASGIRLLVGTVLTSLGSRSRAIGRS